MNKKSFKSVIRKIKALNTILENYITYYERREYNIYWNLVGSVHDFELSKGEVLGIIMDIKSKYIYIEDEIIKSIRRK